MSNFKNNLKDNYTVIANDVLSSTELSLKAKGLYAFMLSKPDNWQFSYSGLTHQLQEGEKAIRSAVKELEEFGVLIKLPKKDGRNFSGWRWILHPTEEEKNLLDKSQKGNDPVGNDPHGNSHNGNDRNGNDHIGNDQKGNEISNKYKQILNSNKRIVKKEKNIKKEKNSENLLENSLQESEIQMLMSEAQVDEVMLKEIIEYRKEIQKPFKTIRGVKGILKDLRDSRLKSGKSSFELFEIMTENEWQTVKPSYLEKLGNGQDSWNDEWGNKAQHEIDEFVKMEV